MWIMYRDGMGVCQMGIDGNVTFYDGFAWFRCEDWEMKITIEDVVEIGS